MAVGAVVAMVRIIVNVAVAKIGSRQNRQSSQLSPLSSPPPQQWLCGRGCSQSYNGSNGGNNGLTLDPIAWRLPGGNALTDLFFCLAYSLCALVPGRLPRPLKLRISSNISVSLPSSGS